MKNIVELFKEFMTKPTILLTLSGLFFLACNAVKHESSHLKKFDIDTVKAVIDEANENYSNRFTTDDATFYLERYVKDACLMPIGALEVCGRENIKNYYYGKGENTKYRIAVTAKEVIGGESAVVETGNYEVFYMSGKQHDKGKFIATWLHEDGKWKLHREIWSSDLSKPIGE